MARPETLATTIIAAVFLAALPSLAAQSPAQAPMFDASPMAPSPGPDCFTYLLNLSDCLTFVQGGSNMTKPDPGCCPELANLVDTQPVCLCQLLGNPGQVGISVDVKRALRLPGVCNVTTPPVSLCAAIGVPVAALSPSEGPSSALSPSEGPSAPDESVAASPAPGYERPRSGSPGDLVSSQHFVVGFAVALFTHLF